MNDECLSRRSPLQGPGGAGAQQNTPPARIYTYSVRCFFFKMGLLTIDQCFPLVVRCEGVSQNARYVYISCRIRHTSSTTTTVPDTRGPGAYHTCIRRYAGGGVMKSYYYGK